MSKKEPSPFEALPDKTYDIIFADPPWKFKSNSKKKPGRNVMRHYDTLDVKAICTLPVKSIAAKDSLLFLWTTAPFAMQAQAVMDAWGFRYVSQMVWQKSRLSTGYWVRGQHELLYIAKRGRFPCGRVAPFKTSLITGATGRHSEKPTGPQDRVDEVWPSVRKIELFARKERDGWDAWGNEIS